MTTPSGNGHAPTPALLTFPCQIDIKAVGAHSPRFQAIVHAIVTRHIAPAALLSVTTRESRSGRYLAVTLTIEAVDRAQLDDIYRELSGCQDVLVAL
ncbi:MAG: YbeD family protein [Acidiferrobacter sp.]